MVSDDESAEAAVLAKGFRQHFDVAFDVFKIELVNFIVRCLTEAAHGNNGHGDGARIKIIGDPWQDVCVCAEFNEMLATADGMNHGGKIGMQQWFVPIVERDKRLPL